MMLPVVRFQFLSASTLGLFVGISESLTIQNIKYRIAKVLKLTTVKNWKNIIFIVKAMSLNMPGCTLSLVMMQKPSLTSSVKKTQSSKLYWRKTTNLLARCDAQKFSNQQWAIKLSLFMIPLVHCANFKLMAICRALSTISIHNTGTLRKLLKLPHTMCSQIQPNRR